jgi:hypothetical protein
MFCLLLFIAFSLPFVYRATNKVVGASGECLTPRSHLLHTMLVGTVLYFGMHAPKVQAALAASLFFLLSSPDVYGETKRLGVPLGSRGADCPGYLAIAAHALVYALSMYWLIKA